MSLIEADRPCRRCPHLWEEHHDISGDKVPGSTGWLIPCFAKVGTEFCACPGYQA